MEILNREHLFNLTDRNPASKGIYGGDSNSKADLDEIIRLSKEFWNEPALASA